MFRDTQHSPLLAADIERRGQAAPAGDKSQESAAVLIGHVVQGLPEDLHPLVRLLHVLVVR